MTYAHRLVSLDSSTFARLSATAAAPPQLQRAGRGVAAACVGSSSRRLASCWTGVSGGSAEVCGCRAADVGTLLEGFACEEVTIKVANKGQGVMVKEDVVTHRSIK